MSNLLKTPSKITLWHFIKIKSGIFSAMGNRLISICNFRMLQAEKCAMGNLRPLWEIQPKANLISNTYNEFFSLWEMGKSLWEIVVSINKYKRILTLFCKKRLFISHSGENTSNSLNKKKRNKD